MAEFEMEHWRSRALVAEKERDSARTVLAHLRGYFRAPEESDPRASKKEDLVRGYLRVHDQEWWNREHAQNAVIEALIGADERAEEMPSEAGFDFLTFAESELRNALDSLPPTAAKPDPFHASACVLRVYALVVSAILRRDRGGAPTCLRCHGTGTLPECPRCADSTDDHDCGVGGRCPACPGKAADSSGQDALKRAAHMALAAYHIDADPGAPPPEWVTELRVALGLTEPSSPFTREEQPPEKKT